MVTSNLLVVPVSSSLPEDEPLVATGDYLLHVKR